MLKNNYLQGQRFTPLKIAFDPIKIFNKLVSGKTDEHLTINDKDKIRILKTLLRVLVETYSEQLTTIDIENQTLNDIKVLGPLNGLAKTIGVVWEYLLTSYFKQLMH